LNDLKPGVMTILVATTGYEQAEREVTATSDMSLDFQVARRRPALSGRVTDVDTRVPLAGATIAVLDGSNAGREAVSGSDGRFRLAELWFGGFTVRIRQGTLRWTITKGHPRTPTTRVGTGGFAGTVNWTNLRTAAPRVVYDCPDEPPVGVTLTLTRQQ
jgi:hypothetical protein